jgi:hypothetical protein
MSMETRPLSEPEIEQARKLGYERSDASVRGLLVFALALAVTVALSVVAMYGLFNVFGKTQSLGPPASPFESPDVRVLPPAPKLQPQPRVDLRDYREQQQQALDSYGWVDQHNGVVRIPIARAMDLLLERGLPARPAGAPAAVSRQQQPATAEQGARNQ